MTRRLICVDILQGEFARVGRFIDDYLEHPERYPVLAQTKPGDIVAALPESAPEAGESFDALMDDFECVILPGITHWNHPRFFAYFATSAAPVAIAAEALAATLDVKAMLWRTSPAASELEAVVMRWLGRLLGLSDAYTGIIYDTRRRLSSFRVSQAFDSTSGAREERTRPAAVRVYITEHTPHVEGRVAPASAGTTSSKSPATRPSGCVRRLAAIAADSGPPNRWRSSRPSATSTTSTSVPSALSRARNVWLLTRGLRRAAAIARFSILDGADRPLAGLQPTSGCSCDGLDARSRRSLAAPRLKLFPPIGRPTATCATTWIRSAVAAALRVKLWFMFSLGRGLRAPRSRVAGRDVRGLGDIRAALAGGRTASVLGRSLQARGRRSRGRAPTARLARQQRTAFSHIRDRQGLRLRLAINLRPVDDVGGWALRGGVAATASARRARRWRLRRSSSARSWSACSPTA